MQKPAGDGTTLRQQYEAVERITGKRPPEMNGPPLPAAGAHVWRWFLDLHRGRQCGFSPNPIAYHDMQSYFSLRRERPEPWEIKVLRRLDDVALNAMATKPST
ncbi:hypothetical protein WK57_30325 [Burkholderia ubonensis]|uniref:Uncharacterized protein n=1 Tax=Burkholderia ubonensis TaxID=101571 RepID=A0AA40R5Y3_9BURK|nr:hypothetical protein [Burkholderia ubonensis]KVN92535.1 hypothetical protein WJ68_33470 [Burkholderia ubonensis]KWZ53286.1 hypothetical protein WK57_30325 [Burkholderia ubonensis]